MPSCARLAQAIPRYAERLAVRPGLTGPAQLRLPSDSDLASVRRKLAFDLYYVRNAGPWLDLQLLAGTVLYLLAMAGWTRAVLRAARAGRGNPLCQELALPALAGLAALAVIATTDNAFDYYAPFTQYLAFLTAACVAVSRAPAAEDARAEPAVASAAPEELLVPAR